jgi:uncharacterized protein YhhL (DUF1145 family)
MHVLKLFVLIRAYQTKPNLFEKKKIKIFVFVLLAGGAQKTECFLENSEFEGQY